jgi:hypothetical protein
MNSLVEGPRKITDFFEKLRKQKESERMPNFGRMPNLNMPAVMRPGVLRPAVMRPDNMRPIVTDRAMRPRPAEISPERRAMLEKFRLAALERKEQITDTQKPQFVINSLDKQNNDPMKGNLLDTYRGATDTKLIPSATFTGSTSKIPVLQN